MGWGLVDVEDNKENEASVRDLGTKLSKLKKGVHVLIKEHDDVIFDKTSIMCGLHTVSTKPKEIGEITLVYNFEASPTPPCISMIFLGQILFLQLAKNWDFFKKCKFDYFFFGKSSPIIYIKHLRFEKKLLTNNIYASNDNNIVFRVFNMSSSCFLFQFYDLKFSTKNWLELYKLPSGLLGLGFEGLCRQGKK